MTLIKIILFIPEIKPFRALPYYYPSTPCKMCAFFKEGLHNTNIANKLLTPGGSVKISRAAFYKGAKKRILTKITAKAIV
jgi:hypothetical protein